jgi:hypothetical protein
MTQALPAILPAKFPIALSASETFGGPAGCPNAAQPELQIVSAPY